MQQVRPDARSFGSGCDAPARRPSGPRPGRLAPAGLALLVFLALAGAASAETFGDVRVTLDSPPMPEAWSHGYYVQPISVRNLSPANRRRITLSLEMYATSGFGLRRIARTLELEPGSEARVTLPLPPVRAYVNNLEVRVDGQSPRKLAVRLPSFESDYGSGRERIALLTSRSVRRDALKDRLDAVAGSRPAATGTTAAVSVLTPPPYSSHAVHPRPLVTEHHLTRAEAAPAEWLPEWLAYSAFEGVVLERDEWLPLPAALQDALLQYVRAGGTLLYLGGFPANLPTGATPDVPLAAGLVQRRLHFGSLLAMGDGDPALWLASSVEALRTVWAGAATAWARDRSLGDLHRTLPVIERLSVPVSGIFALLLLFAVVAGPVTLIVLARRNQRIRLFVVLPVLSAAACLLVLVYTFLSEGRDVRIRTDCLTLLDQDARQATTFGISGVYCPFVPRAGFQAGAEVELTPVHPRSWGDDLPREIDWSRGQHLTTGWVQPRIPAYLGFRIPETRRERLEIRGLGPNRLEVVNALGADIVWLLVTDTSGRRYVCNALAAGERRELPTATEAEAGGTSASLPLFRPVTPFELLDFARGWLDLPSSPPFLDPNRYLAVLASAPFADPLLTRRVTRQARSVVLGTYTLPAQGAQSPE